jgi:hypothetical protein
MITLTLDKLILIKIGFFIKDSIYQGPVGQSSINPNPVAANRRHTVHFVLT